MSGPIGVTGRLRVVGSTSGGQLHGTADLSPAGRRGSERNLGRVVGGVYSRGTHDERDAARNQTTPGPALFKSMLPEAGSTRTWGLGVMPYQSEMSSRSGMLSPSEAYLVLRDRRFVPSVPVGAGRLETVVNWREARVR